jgi:bifunctional non-homologous end joining protein LigD
LFEPKLDGLRAIAVRNGEKVNLLSRNRLSFNARFPAIVAALSALPATNFVLDGEVVGLVDGWPDFAALQQGQEVPVEYWVFDLPWLLGHDLRRLAIEERKSLLARTVNNTPGLAILASLKGAPTELFDKACAEGWEGLVAKRSGSHYREGRSADWRKLKCGCRQEFVVAGFTEPRGSRHGFGALLLGYWHRGVLMYAGKVGAGFTHDTLVELSAQLVGLEQGTSPFAERVHGPGAHWVAPQLVADVAFGNWTPDGRLRHPSFLGLRPDKAGREVVRETCGPGPRPARPGS